MRNLNARFLIPDSVLLLLPKLLCAWKQWYQARVYDLATEMARVYDLATEMARRKEVSYAIFYCTQEYSVLLSLSSFPRTLLLSMDCSLVRYLVYVAIIALHSNMNV